jgi:signal peptidase I
MVFGSRTDHPRGAAVKKKRSVIIPVSLAILIVFLPLRLAFLPYKIPTNAMAPTLRVGDEILVDTLIYKFQPPQRGDVIVFPYPLNPRKDFVERIVGLPNEQIKIEKGDVSINGKLLSNGHRYVNREDWPFGQAGQVIQIPSDSYFVLGDNSAHSAAVDSRQWGFVKKQTVRGKVSCIYAPFHRLGKVS